MARTIKRKSRSAIRHAATSRFKRYKKSPLAARTTIARFAQSRFRYRKNRLIAKKLSQFGETKLQAGVSFDEQAPFASANVNAPNFRYLGFCMGARPTAWDPQIQQVYGTNIGQGVGRNHRVGDYVYLRKARVSMNIDMNMVDAAVRPPIQFRVLQLKSRRAVTPAGTVRDPGNDIFLGPAGEIYGYATLATSKNSYDYYNAMINKADWVVARDFKFTLSSPNDVPNSVGYSGKYPCSKNVVFNCGYWKKTRYNSSNAPTDIDPSWLMLVLAKPIGKDHPPDNWEVNLRSTISWTDV